MLIDMEPGQATSESMMQNIGRLSIERSETRCQGVLNIKSSAFEDGKPMPRKYAADGENISPPLTWSGTPIESKELVIICEDPDAARLQAHVHWIIYNIDPQITTIAEGVKPISGADKGINSSGTMDYTGPMPESGHGLHHYHFQLFALDDKLQFQENPNLDELLKAMAGHVLASGKLVGTYER